MRSGEESRSDEPVEKVASEVEVPARSVAVPDVDAGVENAATQEVEAPIERAATPEVEASVERAATPEVEAPAETPGRPEGEVPAERAARSEGEGPVESAARSEGEGLAESTGRSEGDAPDTIAGRSEVEVSAERVGVSAVDAGVGTVGKPVVNAEDDIAAESPVDGGAGSAAASAGDVGSETKVGPAGREADGGGELVADGTGARADASDAPDVPAVGKRRQPPRKRAVRKRGRAAVTKAAATAAGTLAGAVPRGRKKTAKKKTAKKTRASRTAASRDPFSVRLRSLEREIEDALQEVGGDGPGVSGALQRTGEQLLGFYADLARAVVDGGIEAAFVRLRMIGTADTVDEFGFDAEFYERALPLLRFLHDRWWRVEATGIRHVPRTGRVMLVGNHSGGSMPYDGLMIAHALEARRAGRGRAARPLVEDGAYHFPFAGSPLARLGVVRASAANAERLLGTGQAIVVFPEGAKGSRKYYRDRYRLQRFARGGFVSLALRTGTPLVPVAVVGAEEIYPVLLRWQWLARVLGVPDFAVTPTFPLLGLLGLIPLPTKWRIVFGAPIDLVAEYGADAYDDELLVNRVKESVRERVQRMLIDALRERDSVFTG